jgi:hypothetical protein
VTIKLQCIGNSSAHCLRFNGFKEGLRKHFVNQFESNYLIGLLAAGNLR